MSSISKTVIPTVDEVVDGVAKGEIKLLTTNDVLRIIQRTRQTLNRWLKNPETCPVAFPQPMFRFGHSHRWVREQIVDWLERCTEVRRRA